MSAVTFRGKLFTTVGFVLTCLLLVVVVWVYYQERGIRKADIRANKRISLYLSQIEESIGSATLNTLEIIASDSSLTRILERDKLATMDNVLNSFAVVNRLYPNNVFFIGDPNRIHYVSQAKAYEKAAIEQVRSQLNRAAYKKEAFSQFIYAPQNDHTRLVVTVPINSSGNRYIGTLISLEDIQGRLSKDWTLADEFLLVTDKNGVVVLSNNKQWINRTLSKLPLLFHRELPAIGPVTFSHLGIARVNASTGVVTLRDKKSTGSDASTGFVASTAQTSTMSTRLYYLIDTQSISVQSASAAASFLILYIAFVITCMFIFERTKTRRLDLEKNRLLFASEQYKNEMIEAASAGLLTFFGDGRVDWINEQNLHIFNAKAREDITHVGDIFPQKYVVDLLCSADKNLPIENLEAIGRRQDGGEFPLMFTARKMNNKGGALWLLTLVDLTDKRIAQSELRQAQKLAAIGTMSVTLAHEINQPITAIQTEAAIGKKLLEKHDYSEILKSFDTIIRYTGSLAKITTQLKGFSRKKNLQKSAHTNLYRAIQHVHVIMKSAIENNGVEWQEDIPDTDIHIPLEEYEILQILTNLVQNACDAMSEQQHKTFSLSVSHTLQSVKIRTRDTGIGIPEDMREKIFEPFMSTKKNASSVGLGLAICRDILARYSATIQVAPYEAQNNERSTGASFLITIPISLQRP